MEFIGIDIGSQGTKITLLEQEGKIIAEEYFQYPINCSRPHWAEQDTKDWQQAVLYGLKNISARSANPRKIISIGIAAQVDGIVPIDGKGNPLYPAIIWMDRRAVAEEKLIDNTIGKDSIFRITGCNLDASHVLPKILWLKSNLELFKKTGKLLMPSSYMLFFLTGEFGVDYSNASSTLFFDIKKRVWSEELLKAFDISQSLLPEIFSATHAMGKLRENIASTVGLSHRPIVAVGSGDEHAACIGAGIIGQGAAFDMAGTAEVVGVSSSSPILDPSRLVETHGHASPEHWLLENPGFVSGGNFRWYRDNFCSMGEIRLSYDKLTREAESIMPGSGSLIFLPTMMGAMAPEWNSRARGNIYGLSLNSTREHVTRAILEGSAYGIRDIIEALKKMGFSFSKIRVMGGGSKSRLWNQIKADVLDLSVETLYTSETTSVGAAMIGAVAAGAFPNLEAAIKSTVRVKEIIEPQDERQAYDKLYRLYRELYFSLRPLFSR